MKMFSKLYLLLAPVALLNGCGDTASNPETQTRDSFNPPGFAYTTTGTDSIKIHFTTANVEDDFKGYHILGINAATADVLADIKYPKGVNVADSGIPRCESNTKVFEKFGFEPSTNGCEGGGEDTNTATDNGSSGSTADTDTDKETFTDFLPCAEGVGVEGADKVSLPIKAGKSLEVQTCTVSQIRDVATGKLVDINPGEPMTFVVVAVQGSDYDEVSWTSNFVEDAGSETLIDSQDVTFAKQRYKTITFVPTATDVTATVSASDVACDERCKVNGVNPDNDADKFILSIARDNTSASFPQRLLVSVGKGTAMDIRARGSKTFDPFGDAGNISARIPGDEPTDEYRKDGVAIAMKSNQVFDFKINATDGVRYGKLIVEKVAYATDKNSVATVTLSVIMQTGIDVRHYIR